MKSKKRGSLAQYAKYYTGNKVNSYTDKDREVDSTLYANYDIPQNMRKILRGDTFGSYEAIRGAEDYGYNPSSQQISEFLNDDRRYGASKAADAAVQAFKNKGSAGKLFLSNQEIMDAAKRFNMMDANGKVTTSSPMYGNTEYDLKGTLSQPDYTRLQKAIEQYKKSPYAMGGKVGYQTGNAVVNNQTPFQQYSNKYAGRPSLTMGSDETAAADTSALIDPRFGQLNLGFGGNTPDRVQQANDLKNAYGQTYGKTNVSYMTDPKELQSKRIIKKMGGQVGYQTGNTVKGRQTPFQRYVAAYSKSVRNPNLPSSADTTTANNPDPRFTNGQEIGLSQPLNDKLWSGSDMSQQEIDLMTQQSDLENSYWGTFKQAKGNNTIDFSNSPDETSRLLRYRFAGGPRLKKKK